MYDQIKRAGPELLIPPPPHLADLEAAPRLMRHEDDVRVDPHIIGDREKLRAKVDEDRELKVLERPGLRTSSTAARAEGDVGLEVAVVTVPPAMSDTYPVVSNGEDRDLEARERRDKVKEVRIL